MHDKLEDKEHGQGGKCFFLRRANGSEIPHRRTDRATVPTDSGGRQIGGAQEQQSKRLSRSVNNSIHNKSTLLSQTVTPYSC